MPELDDDKTDKLFQVGAGRHDFEYNPAAWEQMEGMLDADDLRRQRLKWLLLAGSVALLLLLLLGWFQLGEPGLSEQLEPTAEQTGAGLLVAPAPEGAVVADVATGGEENEAAAAPVPLVAVPASGGGPEARKEEQTPEPSPGTVTRQGSEKAVSGMEQVAATPEEQATLPAEEVGNPQKDELTAEPVPLRGQQIVISSIPQNMITALPYEREVPVPELGVAAAPTFTSPKPARGFAVGLSAGFASGKTQTGQLSDPRLRLGGRLDYRLNNHFSIGTGAFLTKVDYQSDGKEYKTDENFWIYDIPPVKVDADCDILEIPLILTWSPHGNQRAGVYFEAGLTSYFMLTEKFNFTYDVPDDELIKNWREDNTNQHLLGMGQVSVGFQRPAGRRSAVQVASFLQLPLTGIGHGKVNLLTVGASVNYSFDFRKRN